MNPLRLQPLGAYCDGSCWEATPLIWRDALVLVERGHQPPFRVRFQSLPGVSTGNNSILLDAIPGTRDMAYVSAINHNQQALWAFATNGDDTNPPKPVPPPQRISTTTPNRTQVHVFWSAAPSLAASSWRHSMILDVSGNEFGFKVYNTGAALGELDGEPAYVLAVEAVFPPNSSLAVSATTLFATCTRCATTGDPSTGWKLLNPRKFLYTRTRYNACPTLRYYSGYWYLVSMFANVSSPRGPHSGSKSSLEGCWAQHIVRSKDLARWEESPVGGGLIMGYPDGDDLGGPDHTLMPNSLFAAHGSALARTLLRNETDDINRSDMDMVTLPSGQTFVTWLSGNQNVPTAPNPGIIGFSIAGLVEGTEEEWLRSFFEPRAFR